MSFMLTTAQIQARTKTVTRRDGWKMLKAGDLLCAVEKSQGLGKGGKIRRLATIRVTSVRRERLDEMLSNTSWGFDECAREGFPNMPPSEFVTFFCNSHRGITPSSEITRIEFEYVGSR